MLGRKIFREDLSQRRRVASDGAPKSGERPPPFLGSDHVVLPLLDEISAESKQPVTLCVKSRDAPVLKRSAHGTHSIQADAVRSSSISNQS